MTDALAHVDRAPWARRRVVVAGIGVSGAAAAEALCHLGAHVTVVDERTGADQRRAADTLRGLGATVDLGASAAATMPAAADLVVASPGWRPTAPLLAAADTRGIPVWGEVELAWRVRRPRADGTPAPWLCVTGTNGKTTTVRMLAAMLGAAGQRTVAAGNVGTPLVAAVLADPAPDVLAVELSSFQLHSVHTVSAYAAAVLNIAPDHVDWHGSVDAYAADKGRIYERCRVACVYNVADDATRRLVEDADVVEGCRAVGFGLGVPAPGDLGVVEDLLVDRAFVPQAVDARRRGAVELATLDDVRPAAPHNVENALAAAALARAFGVPATAVRDGLRAHRPDAHRIAEVAVVDGVRWVDDSKATNPHAAAASLRAVEGDVVWVAGGLAKGATFDDLVREAAPRLRGAVLLGTDAPLVADTLARHAPGVPVVVAGAHETGAVRTPDAVMTAVVAAARTLAAPGTTVLLAPACASMDQFRDYAERGDAFAAAVRALSPSTPPTPSAAAPR